MAIERLPQEVLVIVFKYVHALGAPTSLNSGNLSSGEALEVRDRGVLGLSQVCRSWRQNVLSLSALWASEVDVSCCHPKLNQLVLQRAGPRQLNISLQDVTPDGHGYDNLPLWLQDSHCDRIQSIDIRCFGESISVLLAKCIGQSLPTVQDLTVSIHDRKDSVRYGYLSIVTLPIRHAPAMRRVRLYNCHLPWDASVFSNLSHLCIAMDVDFKAIQKPSHWELDAALSNMHQLVELHFQNYFPDYVFIRGDPSTPMLPIHLSSTCEQVKLETLSVLDINPGDENFDGSLLAARLVPPSTATFNLILSSNGELDGCVRAVAGPSRPAQALSIRTYGQPQDYEVAIGFDAPTSSQSSMGPLDAIQFLGRHIAIIFRTEDWDLEYQELASPTRISRFIEGQHRDVLKALQEINVRELRFLCIDGLHRRADQPYLFEGVGAHEDPSFQDRAPLLAPAVNLEVSLLSDETDVYLLNALITTPIATVDLLFPRLHTLAMRWPQQDSDTARPVIVEFFRKRSTAGHPVKTFQVNVLQGDDDGPWEELQEFTDVRVVTRDRAAGLVAD